MKNVLLKKNWILQVAVMLDGSRHLPYKLGGIYLFSNFFTFHPNVSGTGLQAFQR